ncbi:hypothetical protein [Nonomuraea sp. NPDC003804]|uniref:hypothetical protein n=1 Tax=Nonomuraea sp. NPDC003804 TaxID=3154547 RepID=UPI00339E6B5E
MSREVKRVALDFDWPLSTVWEGYLMPDRLRETKCSDCDGSGWSPRGQYLHSLWYGYVPFDPASNGSTPLTPDSAAVRAFAERNISRAPDYYGKGGVAIVLEATRLADLWNGQWSHHLNDDDVTALVEAGRLKDFTHRWTKEEGWQKIDPPVIPSAEQVNEWSLRGFGHDSINAHIAIEARCKRESVDPICPTCGGYGSVEAYPGQRAEAEAWERTEPPAGQGWQFWETVSEGSPLSPVFATSDELVTWLMNEQGYRLSAAQQVVADGGTVGTFLGTSMDGHPVLLDTARDADIIDSLASSPASQTEEG